MEELFDDIDLQEDLDSSAEITELQKRLEVLESALDLVKPVNSEADYANLTELVVKQFVELSRLLSELEEKFNLLHEEIKNNRSFSLSGELKEQFELLRTDVLKIETNLKTTTNIEISTKPRVTYFDLRNTDYSQLRTNLEGERGEDFIKSDVYNIERDRTKGAKIERIDGKKGFDKILQFLDYQGNLNSSTEDDFEVILSWQAKDDDEKAKLAAFWGLADATRDPQTAKNSWKDYFAIAEYLKEDKLVGSYGIGYGYNYPDIKFDPGANWLKLRYASGGKLGAILKMTKLQPEIIQASKVEDFFDLKWEIVEETRIWQQGISSPPQKAIGAICISDCVNAELLVLAAKLS
ncbi:MAG: hypothetical protein QNJ27_05790 [Simkaniaceae bacterium]|nr:hypothetical protein [Simkaniaceae bacterium]